MMLPLIIYNGMSLAFIVGDVTSDLSQTYFGDAWILIVTSVFYGTNAFCKAFIEYLNHSFLYVWKVGGKRVRSSR